MASVERFCDRALLLERGRIATIGTAEDVSRAYSEVNLARREDLVREQSPDKPFQIVDAWCEDAEGRRIVTQQQGERCRAVLEVSSPRPWTTPCSASSSATRPATPSSRRTARPTGPRADSRPASRAVVAFAFDNLLASGRYDLSAAVSAPQLGAAGVVQAQDVAMLVVASPYASGGAVDIPHELEIRSA